MIRIGIVGCGRILNAHLQGYQRLREKKEQPAKKRVAAEK